MKVSIVMGIYRRPAQFKSTLESIRRQTVQPIQIICTDDGMNPDSDETMRISKDFGVEYYQRVNRPIDIYANSSIPLNISIKKAVGDILIIQCPECRYEDREGIEKLIAPVLANPLVTTVPNVQSLHQNGHSFDQWFIHPKFNPRFLNFCQALRLDLAIKIGGFDERYKGPSADDDDFEARLVAHGAIQTRVDTLVSHQWHQGWSRGTGDFNTVLYFETLDRIARGEKPVANDGKDWGNIKS